jgi:hypothetical protein
MCAVVIFGVCKSVAFSNTSFQYKSHVSSLTRDNIYTYMKWKQCFCASCWADSGPSVLHGRQAGLYDVQARGSGKSNERARNGETWEASFCEFQETFKESKLCTFLFCERRNLSKRQFELKVGFVRVMRREEWSQPVTELTRVYDGTPMQCKKGLSYSSSLGS